MKNFNYFYNVQNLAPANFALYYDFNSGTNPIPSVLSGQPQFSGIISNLNQFYLNSGSGLFSGQNVQISNASGLNASNFTLFTIFDKRTTGNGILFSSLQSGNGASPPLSGFILGINDANRLYFETYDAQGPQIYTSSNIYSSKNTIAVSKSSNILNFYYFNFNSQSLESEQFTISATAQYQSNQAYLGAAINAPSYITQNNFTGYLDQFIYINSALTPNVITKLCSGFYSNKNANSLNITSICNGPITGYTTGVSGSVVVTGYNTYLAGVIYDNCGNAQPMYSYNNLTGIIYQDTFLPLTLSGCYNVTGIIDNGYFIDTGFCNSCGMNGFVLLNYTGGAVEDYNYSFIGMTGTNLLAQYNSDGTYKLDTFYTNNQIELYDNGLTQFSSGYYTSGNGYNSNIYLYADFYVSGQSVLSTGYKSTDTVSYDNTSGIKEIFYGSGAQTFTVTYPNNRLVFNNGQKLTLSKDYNFAGNSLNILKNFTGNIVTIPFAQGFNYLSGNLNRTNQSNFSRNTTEIWTNGIKKTLKKDYVENSYIDLLNGSGIYSNFTGSLYNGNTNFTETF